MCFNPNSHGGSTPPISTTERRRRKFITEQEDIRRAAEELLDRLHETPDRMVKIYNQQLQNQHGLRAHELLLLAEFKRLSYVPNPSS